MKICSLVLVIPNTDKLTQNTEKDTVCVFGGFFSGGGGGGGGCLRFDCLIFYFVIDLIV